MKFSAERRMINPKSSPKDGRKLVLLNWSIHKYAYTAAYTRTCVFFFNVREEGWREIKGSI
jgi:hypothetical protein